MIRLLGKLPTEGFYVCVSGGIDSMTLAHFLLGSKRKFTALYFNHGTEHGELAQGFVEEQMEKLGVPLIKGKIDSKQVNSSKSMEENWRNARYAFFKRYAVTGPILMAHHLDDVIETYIMTSLKGKPRTIPYRNQKYNIIRPFLITQRCDIEDWAENHDVEYVKDPSNDNTRFDRNYVRHKMMPMVKRINPGIATTVKKIVLEKYEEDIL